MSSVHFQVVQVAKNLPAIAGDVRDKDSIPRLGRSPGGGHGNPLYSCREIPLTEEIAGLQSMVSQRVTYNWSDLAQEHNCDRAYMGSVHSRLDDSLSSVQSRSWVQLFVIPWTAAHQASLFITNSWSLPKLMFMESVMPSKHLILCYPLLLPPSIFSSIRVFSSESVLCIRWPKYWS